MVTCSFCGLEIPRGSGLMYVKTDGKVFHFCSRKCEKNMIVLKRKPRETRWTNEHNAVKKVLIASKEEAKLKEGKKE
ncbi:50S ribosomal protein L24e [Candidatus Woesearchaeota archaeon]|jgi:large subunit ribosomal protein L24e|nr:50S ribosomal protein L24e [Candidatus Woesearchaeota archaeon]MBT3537817.1 50S ribosomal protein L24e [Candidatus Woesearchaeota archaeon]MBT4697948.1 50S ribosomal protein L24e [Candidatus Woesearchaeota archaeon]MBT7105486.1 50S ribosomal protein L24e [Candidatus Woesearchaeota archaeon]MBT7931676.1 50S ribosomal protein L24e [Candidatus Woesearchaeota archaeon]